MVPILSVEPLAGCADITQPGCASRLIAITVQIPFNISAEDPEAKTGVPVPAARVSFVENGIVAASVDVVPLVDQVHVLTSCDLMLSRRDGSCAPAVTHANGTLVSRQHPAAAGEEIVVFAVGLGYTTLIVPNGQAPDAAVSPSVSFRVSFDPRPNALASRPSAIGENGSTTATPDFAGLLPGFVDLYQINVTIPPLPKGSQNCDPSPLGARVSSNLTINIFGPASVDGVGICIDAGS